jgi:hypothetical protein
MDPPPAIARGGLGRLAADGSRSRKHTRWVDLGMADRLCTATHDYSAKPTRHHEQQNKTQSTPKLGERKFTL